MSLPSARFRAMESTWETRELPVLRAIVEHFDETGDAMRPEEIARATGFDPDTVQRALRFLQHESPSLITKMDSVMTGEIVIVGYPTGEALRRVGAWPTPENLVDRLVAGFNRAAEAEEDEDKRSRLNRFAAWLATGGRDIAVQVAGTAVAKSIGM